ncbi:hypothetical protein VMCG_10432 [Cytospora schulzeri]|uniref:Uncharacterized protein n=1 Tax=Cytospora schulzeri TaxID=448051 RepID=A0A423VB37_9PEZI|nr:hypothetical protein VMCG_10432 [Valsa malicola]
MADSQVKARKGDVVLRRYTPVIEELDQDIEMPELKKDEDDDGPTVDNASNDDLVESTLEYDDDEDDSDAATTLSSSPLATATFFPTTSPLEHPSTLLTLFFNKHNELRNSGSAIGLVIALIWVGILIRQRRRRHDKNEPNTRNYPSRINQHFRLKATFHIPSIPHLPSFLASPLVRFTKPESSATPRRQVSNPSRQVYVSGHEYAPSVSWIPNTDPQAADRTDGDVNHTTPKGWLVEKRHETSYPVSLLDPDEVAERSGNDNTGILDELPPMPDLGLQKMYTNETTATQASATSGEETVTAPPLVFTQKDARAYYKRIWAEFSVAGNTEL